MRNKDTESFSMLGIAKVKVKVKAKPTNASRASGRCKCPKCHDHPVSKALSKTKGRNKRRFLVDDDWAFCTRHIKVASSRVDHDAGFQLSDHDVDGYAYDARDVICHAEVKKFLVNINNNSRSQLFPDKLMCPHVNDNACDGHNIDEAHNVSAAPDVHPTKADDAIIDDDDDAYDDYPEMMMHTQHVFAQDGNLCISPQICAKANDVVVDDGDVNHGGRAMMAHAEDDVSLEDDYEDIADKVRDDDDEANEVHSVISGFENVEWPPHDGNEEVSDAESKENSISVDWCHVISSDAIDDWYFC